MGLAEELPVYKKSYDCKPLLITITNIWAVNLRLG